MRNAMVAWVGVMMGVLGACDTIEPDNEVAVEAAGLSRHVALRDERAPATPSLMGRVTIDEAEQIAAPWADIVVQPLVAGEVAETPPTEGFRHHEIETQADEGGFFSVAELPDGASAAALSVFVDGEFAHSETLAC